MSGRLSKRVGTDTWCSPCNKVLFPTRKRAEQVARKQRLRLYDCPSGPGFHLGHAGRPEQQPTAQPTERDVFTGSMDDLQRLAQQIRLNEAS